MAQSADLEPTQGAHIVDDVGDVIVLNSVAASYAIGCSTKRSAFV